VDVVAVVVGSVTVVVLANCITNCQCYTC